LNEGQYLLEKNYISNAPPKLNKDELNSILVQQPNRKILPFMRFHLQMYNLPSEEGLRKNREKKDARIVPKNVRRELKGKELKGPGRTKREWLREIVGEPPVLLDSNAIRSSAQQLSTYLIKKGYFQNHIQDAVIISGKKRASVEYKMSWESPYTVRQFLFEIQDTRLDDRIRSTYQFKKLKPGMRFDMDVMSEERVLLTTFLRNNGYYEFNKEFIRFQVDSTLTGRAVDVIIQISSPLDKSSESGFMQHKRFAINTILFKYKTGPEANNDTLFLNGYSFMNPRDYPLKEKVLIQNTFIQSGELFNQRGLDMTYRRLIALPVLDHVRIRTVPVEEDKLDMVIELSPAKRQGVSVEGQGTNNGGFLGLEGNLVYRHKNIFRGAETMEIKLNGGAQAQTLLTQNTDNSQSIQGDYLKLNTIEFGPSLSFIFPKFLLPISQDRFARSSNPSTTINGAFNFQQRPDFRRRVTSTYIGYQWKESIDKNHQVNLVELSVIRIAKSDAFQAIIEEFNDRFLLDSYQDHFILGSSYSFNYDRQDKEGRKNDLSYRARVEGGGNSLRLAYDLSGAQKDSTGSYEIFGIRFAQFVKLAQDFRYYRRIDKRRSLVSRFAVGVGVPLTNLGVLPFSKSFFGGGANGLRAWRARTIGPGSYFEPLVSYDKIGDIQLEANVEYRFNLIDYIDGAFFVDVGNIWLLKPDVLRPGGDFQFDRFLSEVSVGAGLGLRIDFDFFLLRFDLAAQLKDPSLKQGERWIFQPKGAYNQVVDEYNSTLEDGLTALSTYRLRLNFNLGIGYPF